ncbi:MAG TPA: S1 RNA-binding domain-containing protein [Candidatus Kapabacteria bacterium]|jgi:small subunit ribosomal protein S1|nr:S1 RNA-binding domain-containing protein [Candidatus Kapabacteria bacterium]
MEDFSPIPNESEQDASSETPASTPSAQEENSSQKESADPSIVGIGGHDATVSGPGEELRAKMRDKESVSARIVKWQRNGLEVELDNGVKAFMPNDMIDRDPNRNVANYFGKTVPVKIASVRSKPGQKEAEITVSHRAVLEEELRNAGREAIKDINVGDVVEVKIKSFSKDNVLVDMGAGIDAVIRLRDLSWQHVEHPYEILKRGDTVTAKILSLDRGRRRVQLGIRQLTPDPELAKYAEYQSGAVMKGQIKMTNNYGAELELPNGLIAFLPISEIAWERIASVTDVLNVGDEVEVKLLTVDSHDRRITASRKLLIENPLRKIESTFRMGTDHNGTIKEVTRGGVVVALEHGAEGFVPRRELSHDRIERLEDAFKAGKTLEGLRVIEYDRRSSKITLSLIAAEKEAQRNTLRNYRPTSNASSYSLADSLAALKEQLQQQERNNL